jgi:predicted N-acetyltransferase YhbS
MPEGGTYPEHPSRPIPIESKSLTEISKKEIDELGDFSDKSINAYIKSVDPDEREELGVTAFVHAQAVATLNDAIRNRTDLNFASTKNEKGEIIGYSLVTFDLNNPDPYNRVKTEFLGVDSENRGKGIATNLMKQRIKVLKELGIPGYRTISRVDAKKVYDRLGIKYEIEPLPDRSNFAKDAQKLLVHL